MGRKRNKPEVLLGRLIGYLEESPEAAGSREGRRILLEMIEDGPDVAIGDMRCEVLGTAPEEIHPWSAAACVRVQRELREYVRALVKLTDDESGGFVPELRVRLLSRGATTVNGDVFLTVDGRARDVLYHQVLGLLHQVGIRRISECRAGCGRIFVKAWRREFCSRQCQARIYMRQRRLNRRRNRRRQGSRKP